MPALRGFRLPQLETADGDRDAAVATVGGAADTARAADVALAADHEPADTGSPARNSRGRNARPLEGDGDEDAFALERGRMR